MFWDDFVINIVKSPHVMVAEREGVKNHKGLSALIL